MTCQWPPCWTGFASRVIAITTAFPFIFCSKYNFCQLSQMAFYSIPIPYNCLVLFISESALIQSALVSISCGSTLSPSYWFLPGITVYTCTVHLVYMTCRGGMVEALMYILLYSNVIQSRSVNILLYGLLYEHSFGLYAPSVTKIIEAQWSYLIPVSNWI